ncbi:hypothetical protein A1O1_06253 [Capronia coronata CBS 617.96]|uniref:Nuclease S1 n=1 Tax=Capronia coronata CBS 617.96 TaxID=1182541 RepID=W9YUD6_9EURO|nr:uncharacterized protein A1O1_06253 [Capronia coronata CBS 617.96]EXJ85884.1 hypothetical protein A1O1_06253 [Capronia coronata CBS 617.96]
MHSLIVILTLLSPLPHVSAWGSLGHRTVAYLASMYFTTESTVMTNHLLHGQDISEAALFADKVRHMPQFAYSAGWHYIDARDDPPRHCGINMTRDCGDGSGSSDPATDSDADSHSDTTATGGCVVSAIANHTQRVSNLSLPAYFRGQSLRFMIHFFGDVHQPLHTEAEDRGGNEYAVTFDGKATNLHSAWDTLIPNKLVATAMARNETKSSNHHSADVELLDAWEWARRLYDKHERDELGVEDHADDDDHDECLTDPAECALQWASEANAHVCLYVLARDVRGQDLGGDYYDGAVPIINDMVAKAGRRLAVWINAISATEHDHAALLQTQ